MPGQEVFPTPQGCIRLLFNEGQKDELDNTVFDVKFYPYPTTNNDQIFAVVAADSAVILRPKLGSDPPFEYLQWFRDEHRNDQNTPASYNSLCWTKDAETKKPLLCIAGSEPHHIKILDVESGRPVRTLTGHGSAINDLIVSPLSSDILASASNDNTIRLWNLHETHCQQPCVALFAGGGHKSHVLAIHFHPNGCWILSGGVDTAVCLWAVPSLAELDNEGDYSPHRDSKIVFYPHFFSKEVHPNYVDCLAFYGDLVVSKAARENMKNDILIWRIEGFDSSEPPPSEPPVPVPGQQTRSSFPHDSRFRGFQRLLTLESPHTPRFYHRFGLLHDPGMRPILAMGNEQSTYFFWDLARFDEGVDPKDRLKKKTSTKRLKTKASKDLSSLLPNGFPAASSSRDGTPSSITELSTTSASAEREYTLSDPFKPMQAHFKKVVDTELTKNRHFATSQIAFSPDGTWMVGVGDHGMICLFHRDKGVIGSAPLQADGAS